MMDEMLLKVFNLRKDLAVCQKLGPVFAKYGGRVLERHTQGKCGLNVILAFPSQACLYRKHVEEEVRKAVQGEHEKGAKKIGVERYETDAKWKDAAQVRRRSRLLMVVAYLTNAKDGTPAAKPDKHTLQAMGSAICGMIGGVGNPISCLQTYAPDAKKKKTQKNPPAAQVEFMIQFSNSYEAFVEHEKQRFDGTKIWWESLIMHCHTGQQYRKREYYPPADRPVRTPPSSKPPTTSYSSHTEPHCHASPTQRWPAPDTLQGCHPTSMHHEQRYHASPAGQDTHSPIPNLSPREVYYKVLSLLESGAPSNDDMMRTDYYPGQQYTYEEYANHPDYWNAPPTQQWPASPAWQGYDPTHLPHSTSTYHEHKYHTSPAASTERPCSPMELSSCADSTSGSETPSNGDLQVCCYPTTPVGTEVLFVRHKKLEWLHI